VASRRGTEIAEMIMLKRHKIATRALLEESTKIHQLLMIDRKKKFPGTMQGATQEVWPWREMQDRRAVVIKLPRKP